MISFEVALFIDADASETRRSRAVMLTLLEALCQVNTWYLVTYPYPDTPTLYKSAVTYKREPKRTEHWRDIPTLLRIGSGDCEDLACWRVAEMRNAGIRAEPYIRWGTVPGNKHSYHALVKWPDGRLEDPSLSLGMRGEILRQPIFV